MTSEEILWGTNYNSWTVADKIRGKCVYGDDTDWKRVCIGYPAV